MATIEEKRHTLAHLLAAAVLERYPHARPAIGPAIDTGFYYDFDFSGGDAPGEADLPALQEAMERMLPSWTSMAGVPASPADARERYAGNPYKLELIEGIEERGEALTLYTAGSFTDLCRGGHCESPAEDIAPGSFALERVAGAYWRGDEKNPMLARVYGLAFETKEELEGYRERQAEARKRDHRKLGTELDLFAFSPLVGPGMPLFTPRGAAVRTEIIEYSRELNRALGFGEVHTPNANKAELFKTSGHYDQYKEDMLSVSSQYVKDEMFLKPMNCPQHTQIYASRPRSYRDLPIRYADFSTLYRDERPGELSGLTRLRAFSQDDGHIFCREEQVKEELLKVLEAIRAALSTYRIGYWIRLSLRDPGNKEKYLGSDEDWARSEGELRDVLDEAGVEYRPAEGEAAFYGPKLDVMAVDALGREWQISTIQVDRAQPARFGLEYADSDGARKAPVMIHRALIGSPDRFLGILIEHYGGEFPAWLAPEQVRVLPVAERHHEYARGVLDRLVASGRRATMDGASDSLGKRIRAAKGQKVPYLVILGDAEMEAGLVKVEGRDGNPSEPVPLADFVSSLAEKVASRS